MIKLLMRMIKLLMRMIKLLMRMIKLLSDDQTLERVSAAATESVGLRSVAELRGV
jgi:hypothetical protein